MSNNAPLLNRIDTVSDIKKLKINELKQLCQEIRDYTIQTVSATGGHLAPTLGVVELTVALHYVFSSPKDKIIWDVGHQAYAHKILTGRRDALPTIRQYGGISGFLKRKESEHDIFGAGHASTSISAGVGLAKARDLKGGNYQVISVIGDGALTGGLAFEGLNNLGSLRTRMMLILNDNEMSISPNVGAMSKYLSKIVTNPLYNQVRDEVWKMTGRLPVGKRAVRTGVRKLEESLKNLIVPGVLFDEMGIRYFGPINGNDIELLIETLENIKDIQTPTMLHILTKKGLGYEQAEADPVKFHGVGPSRKTVAKTGPLAPPYLKVFGDTLIRMAEADKRIVAISAAMREGTGLHAYAERFPGRFFDVGIAEGHAVTFAAGLAVEGIRPFVAIYSTFLQRAFDMLVHDVALQQLPVIFMLDRSGLVGEDGQTHHGALDLSYLSAIPNVVVAAPRDGNELVDLMRTAVDYTDGPIFIRYPKDSSREYDPDYTGEVLPIGEWQTVREGSDTAILAVGAMNGVVDEAMDILKEQKTTPTWINARYIKPMDESLLKKLFDTHRRILVVEENVYTGGLGQRIQAYAKSSEIKCRIEVAGLPDAFVTHGARQLLLNEVGLTAEALAARVLAAGK